MFNRRDPAQVQLDDDDGDDQWVERARRIFLTHSTINIWMKAKKEANLYDSD